jgi:hypothetical protein
MFNQIKKLAILRHIWHKNTKRVSSFFKPRNKDGPMNESGKLSKKDVVGARLTAAVIVSGATGKATHEVLDKYRDQSTALYDEAMDILEEGELQLT